MYLAARCILRRLPAATLAGWGVAKSHPEATFYRFISHIVSISKIDISKYYIDWFMSNANINVDNMKIIRREKTERARAKIAHR
jgi:hypothetical protein